MTFTDEYNGYVELAARAFEASGQVEMARELRKLKQDDQFQARAKVGGVTGNPASDASGDNASPSRSR